MKVDWSFMRTEALSAEARESAERTKYFVADSFNENGQSYQMNYTGEYYQFYFELGPRKRERFKIFLARGMCFYPSVTNASPHTRHDILGPESSFTAAASSNAWVIGHDAKDQAEDGKRYEVRLFVDEGGHPERLDWLPVRGT